MDEGYIKFNCEWIQDAPVKNFRIKELIKFRNMMRSQGLIGMNENGVGYGNISARKDNNKFYISGSATGGIDKADYSHFTLVEKCAIADNLICCRGPVKASSESLTHAAVYEANALVNSVIHIHNYAKWNEFLNIYPTTNIGAKYGTPEMANEIKEIVSAEKAASGIIIMGGHEEGIISYGENIKKAYYILIERLNL